MKLAAGRALLPMLLAAMMLAEMMLAGGTALAQTAQEQSFQGKSLAEILSEDAKAPHPGYYYPPPQSEETYTSPLKPLDGVDRTSRIGLVVGITKQQNERNFSPGFHIFAKGAYAEKLILVATEDGRYDTLYRLRALLASLSSEARLSDLFQKSGTPEQLNFLDLLKLAGITQLTISNGRDLSHTIFVR
jgi:hypothetical protein